MIFFNEISYVNIELIECENIEENIDMSKRKKNTYNQHIKI